MKKKIVWILLFCILFLAFFLRSQEMISSNYLFLLDQGRDMMAVKDIVYNHHFTLIGPYTSLQGVFQGPLWYYMLAIPTFLLSANPIGGVILMVLISMTVVLISFIFVYKNFGIRSALLTSFLFATSPQAVAAATYSWNPHPMWLLILLYIFSLYIFVIGKNSFIIFLFFLTGLMFHFESALAIFFLIATLTFVIWKKRRVVQSKYFVYAVVAICITFLPQIIFDLRHDMLMTKSIGMVLSGKSQGLTTSSHKANFISNALDHYQVFINNYKGAFTQEGFPEFFPLLFFLATVVTYFYFMFHHNFSKKEQTFIKLNIFLIAFIFFLTLFYPFPLRYWFLTGFETLFILTTGIILSKLRATQVGKVLLLVTIFYFTLSSAQKIYRTYTKPDYGGVAKVKGKRDAIDFIYNDSDKKPFNLFVFNPPVYTDAYDYLIFWAAKSTYHYIPGKEKNGVFYLLMEPDPVKPYSYKGWEETVIKSGNVLWTKKLPSGLIVQKREASEKNSI